MGPYIFKRFRYPGSLVCMERVSDEDHWTLCELELEAPDHNIIILVPRFLLTFFFFYCAIIGTEIRQLKIYSKTGVHWQVRCLSKKLPRIDKYEMVAPKICVYDRSKHGINLNKITVHDNGGPCLAL